MTFLVPVAGSSLFKVYHGSAFASAVGSGFSFTDRDIGPEHPDRQVLVASGLGRESTSATAVSVAGNVASLVIGNFSTRRCQLHMVGVPTGTTATIGLSAGTSVNGGAIHWWSIYPVTPTTVDTISASGGSLDTVGANFINAAAFDFNPFGTTITWSGIVQEGTVSWQIGSNVFRLSVASDDSVSGTHVLSITGSSGGPGMCAASFGI